MSGFNTKEALEVIRRQLKESADTVISVHRNDLSVLHDELTMLHAICESFPDGVFVKDLQGRLIMKNKVGPHPVEMDLAQNLGGTARETLSPDTANRIEQEDALVLAREEMVSFESMGVVDGEQRSFETSKMAYRDADGKLIGILGVSRDITLHKHSEVARKVHEARFERLLEVAPDAIVGTDDAGTIVLVNAQAEHMFGYGRDELIGNQVEILMPERMRQPHMGHRSSYFSSPKTRPMGTELDLIARRKNGQEFPVEISLSPLETEEGTFVTSIIRDITDRKDMESQLRRHTVQLEEQVLQAELLATIGRMAAQVAHEIRNPLSTIGLNIELLADEMNAHAWDERAEADELIQITLTEIERLNNVISDYLQFARMPAQQMHELSVNDVASEVFRFIRPEADQCGVDLVLELGDDMDPVRMDPIIFRQAVLNCIRNGIEAMPDGGTLSISTAMKGFYTEVAISDSGTGIPPEDHGRVFDPFFSTKDRGTGLGLPYVRQIVTEYGGILQLDSAPGAGTTIAIRLPSASDGET